MSKRELNPILASTEISELVKLAKSLKKEIDAMQQKLEMVKKDICLYMGGNEDLVNEDGEVIASWAQPNSSKRFDTQRFKREQIHLYNSYVIETLSDRRFLLK